MKIEFNNQLCISQLPFHFKVFYFYFAFITCNLWLWYVKLKCCVQNKIAFMTYTSRRYFSQTSPHRHVCNTDTSLLQTVYLVSKRSQLIYWTSSALHLIYIHSLSTFTYIWRFNGPVFLVATFSVFLSYKALRMEQTVLMTTPAFL